MTLRIGLTGGIGSGKTVVTEFFKILGVPVYYADAAAKNIMNEDLQLREAISNEFGEAVYTRQGLDRSYLASIVFGNRERLDALNALVHPATIRASEQWMTAQSAPYAIKEAALIFESGSNKQLDYVIGVSAPLELRLSRVMMRDGITREAVEKRISHQMDEAEKMNRCDFVIINDEHQAVIPQVLALHHKLLTL